MTNWWLMPTWLDLELRRYLAACAIELNTELNTERTGEGMAKDPRTQQERLHDRHGGLNRNPNDAQKVGEVGKPKR